VVDDRDRLLLRALDSIHQRRRHEAVEVAVVYGAGHMPAVVQYLSARLGYRAASAQWFTVFEF
jgi:pheromone shutdown protein TraB